MIRINLMAVERDRPKRRAGAQERTMELGRWKPELRTQLESHDLPGVLRLKLRVGDASQLEEQIVAVDTELATVSDVVGQRNEFEW